MEQTLLSYLLFMKKHASTAWALLAGLALAVNLGVHLVLFVAAWWLGVSRGAGAVSVRDRLRWIQIALWKRSIPFRP